MNVCMTIGVALFLTTGTAARARAGEMSRLSYRLFVGQDLSTKEAHVSVISDTRDPGSLYVLSAGSRAGLLLTSHFQCVLPGLPEAYWEVRIPYATKPAHVPKGWEAVAIVPANQFASSVEVVLGCRAAVKKI